MEWFLYTMLLRDLARFGRLIVWVAVALLTGAMAMGYTRLNPGSENAYTQMSSVLVFRILALAGAIFSTSVVAQEIEQKTIIYLLTRPVSRAKLVLMRTLAAATMTTGVSLLSALCVAFAVDGPKFLQNEYLWRDVPALVIGGLAYCSLFVFISLVANRSMIINLLYAFAWESSIPNMPGSMYLLSIASYLQAISQRPEVQSGDFMQLLSGGLSVKTLTQGQGFMAMGLLIAVMLALSMFWFTRFEYTPREDAE